MASSDMKLTVMRGAVVLHVAAAALCLTATALMLPLFKLTIDTINSSITQSLWTTDIHTPVAEKHIAVSSFTKDCTEMTRAFQVAQWSMIASIAALCVAFVMAVFHMAPSYTVSRYRVRTVCGLPICLLLLTALIFMGLHCYTVRALFEHNWCEPKSALGGDKDYEKGFRVDDEVVTRTAITVDAPATILYLPGKKLHHIPVITELHERSAVQKIASEPLHVLRYDVAVAAAAIDAVPTPPDILHLGDCNPFDGCISSYRAMGFEPAAGFQLARLALMVALTALFTEMMIIAVSGSQVAVAGVDESTVVLLQEDNERIL